MVKILLRDTRNLNRGDAARAVCTFKILRRFIKDLQMSSLSVLPEYERDFCDSNNVEFVLHQISAFNASKRFILSTIYNCLYHVGLEINWLIKDDLLQRYKNSDIIMSLTGDALSDDGGVRSSMIFCINVLPCIFLHKPFIIFSTSIGPFKTKFSKYLAKFTLNRTALIIVREGITLDILAEMGVNKNLIKLAPDPAFILESASNERINEIFETNKINAKSLVGMTVTMVFKSFEDDPSLSDINYFKLMSRIAEYIVRKTDATILFIPESIVLKEGSHDDRYVAKEISKLIESKDKVMILDDEYTPEELKGIIGRCDFFIGTRLHACIFAASMGIPFLAIAYSHKAYGIVEMLKQDKYVLSYNKLDYDSLKSKIDDILLNKEQIRKELSSEEIDLVKSNTWNNGKMVKSLIDNLRA